MYFVSLTEITRIITNIRKNEKKLLFEPERKENEKVKCFHKLLKQMKQSPQYDQRWQTTTVKVKDVYLQEPGN